MGRVASRPLKNNASKSILAQMNEKMTPVKKKICLLIVELRNSTIVIIQIYYYHCHYREVYNYEVIMDF